MNRLSATLTLLLLLTGLRATAQLSLDSIARLLSDAPVQEKVYLHIDNTCYHKGDTIWYKSYVVRADDLRYTDMSRILYVELVSPDGLMVERQNVIVSADGYGNGCFSLPDSLYSGYYELRAYTRWMMNFCVTEHAYNRTDREQFYNRQMARDFFRQFGTVYSRVVPVYERPDSLGDYSQKYIVNRPKTRMEKEQKARLTVDFYPEGGHLVAGTRCNVAFEATDEEGAQVDIAGTLDIDGQTRPIATSHRGRGCFTVDVPERGSMRAHFNYEGKDYTFSLPKTEDRGCALFLEDGGDDALKVHLDARGISGQLGVAVLCRGVLKQFLKTDGSGTVAIDGKALPTGVCDLLVFSETGVPLADRLFFVNHHDYALQPVMVSGLQPEYEPYAPVTLDFQAPAGTPHISISVRDATYDEPTYDTGNIMTDLLLASDLKGFIAHPEYYFQADDDEHRHALDLLMMVQGWRRYDLGDLLARHAPRYQPEKTMSVEGAVYKTVDFEDVRECEVGYWLKGVFNWCPDDMIHRADGELETLKSINGDEDDEDDGSTETVEDTPQSADDPNYGINHRGLRHEVMVKGELVVGKDVAEVEMETTDGGRFSFSVPPYYGDGILFLSAYKKDISDKKKQKLENRGFLDEDAWPEFYVKRDLFFPVFARKYDYYQCHQPDMVATESADGTAVDDLLTQERLSKFDTQLDDIEVKARRRRGRRHIDYSKPAYVYDAYELYNLVTDYGLSYGKLNFRRFPVQVSMALLGNYNSERLFNVEARMSDNQLTPYIFYRNYSPLSSVNTDPYRSNHAVYSNLRLNRQNEIRLFTDFELRNEEKPIEQSVMAADVTLDFSLMPDESKRYTYRDRRLVLPGMHLPVQFYSPDYSRQPLPTKEAPDYRRTLYWNPNARLDDDGHFTATFYNNCRHTRMRVTTAGVFTPATDRAPAASE